MNNNQGNKLIRLLKVPEVAHMLAASNSFVYGLVKKGEIPAVRLGRGIRLRLQDIQIYIDQNTAQFSRH